ncbi:MAG: hypothetical protein WCD18_15335 [Thermosynechococcaceae cyanobacterium]
MPNPAAACKNSMNRLKVMRVLRNCKNPLGMTKEEICKAIPSLTRRQSDEAVQVLRRDEELIAVRPGKRSYYRLAHENSDRKISGSYTGLLPKRGGPKVTKIPDYAGYQNKKI